MTPTLHTLTNWLNPWRTIRRLEAENQALVDTLANPTLTGVAIHKNNATFDGSGPGPQLLAGIFLGLLKEHPEAVNYLEITYGSNQGPVIVTVQKPGGASPHELRAMAEREAKGLREQLARAREALGRVAFGGWFENSQFSVDYHARVVEGVADWVRSGMAGPLPPLPEYLAKRELADAGKTP